MEVNYTLSATEGSQSCDSGLYNSYPKKLAVGASWKESLLPEYKSVGSADTCEVKIFFRDGLTLSVLPGAEDLLAAAAAAVKEAFRRLDTGEMPEDIRIEVYAKDIEE